MATKIENLKNQMVNVTVTGKVRRKSDLKDMTKSNGKYFFFYLSDAANSQIRIIAFKTAAEKFFSIIEDNKSYQIAKVAVKNNAYNGNVELQITLTTDAIITEIQGSGDVIHNPLYTPILEVTKCMSKGFVDVLGCIIETQKMDCIMQSGEVKSVMIVTLRDATAYIDVTFWDQIDDVEHISPDDTTILAIESATVNFYKGAVTLNVNKSAKITINPVGEAANQLHKLDDQSVSINLSQSSQEYSQNNELYSASTLISAIKRSLERVKEKEEQLKIKKYLLEQQLHHYESKK